VSHMENLYKEQVFEITSFRPLRRLAFYFSCRPSNFLIAAFSASGPSRDNQGLKRISIGCPSALQCFSSPLSPPPQYNLSFDKSFSPWSGTFKRRLSSEFLGTLPAAVMPALSVCSHVVQFTRSKTSLSLESKSPPVLIFERSCPLTLIFRAPLRFTPVSSHGARRHP